MRRPRIYLETTLFNFYVDESKGIDHINTVRLFEDIAAGKYEAFTSAYVVRELNRASEEKRDKMLNLIAEYDITVLDDDDDAEVIADVYVEERIIPQKYITDGLHIALATVHRMDMIVSMNFRHIVKQQTIRMTTHISVQKGYRAVKICSPKEVVENGKED